MNSDGDGFCVEDFTNEELGFKDGEEYTNNPEEPKDEDENKFDKIEIFHKRPCGKTSILETWIEYVIDKGFNNNNNNEY